MPKALPKELKQEIQSLFVAGLPPTQIARKYADRGVSARLVGKWAERGRWVALRDKIRPETDTALIEGIKESMARASNAVKQNLADELLEEVQTLRKHRPKLSGLHKRATTARVIADSASTVFRWGEEKVRPIVSLEILGSVSLKLPPSPTAEIVDVVVEPAPES